MNAALAIKMRAAAFSLNIFVPQDAKHEGTHMHAVSDILTVHFFIVCPLVPRRRNATATAGTHIPAGTIIATARGCFPRADLLGLLGG